VSIRTALRPDLDDVLRRFPTKTILWLDRARERERLLAQLGGEFELVPYDGSQLAIRAKVDGSAENRAKVFG
jgi:hypothetical protein